MSKNYNAPLDEIKFLLKEFINIEEILSLTSPDISVDVIDAILEEAAKFASNELAPINRIGDVEGCKFENGAVKTPTGFKEAYRKFIENGWNSVPFSPEYGGQGLPWVVSVAIGEMWNGANMAFSLCPLLTQGAVESISHHGSTEQKEKYLAKLISGEWTGTMCLTEPQAGSDLAAIRTKATPNGDHYLIKGQKIFITYGEHDFTDNIIHMVLARTPNAPEGVKGISLFIVPKFIRHCEESTEGSMTKQSSVNNKEEWIAASHSEMSASRNDVRAISIEHKLGIHASPTAVMSFGEDKGAIGYLVGEENQGLKYMFTMMNNARLSVGVEGLGISESSYQMALEYAKERVQGKIMNLEPRTKNLEIPSSKFQVPNTILSHPDVARMLLTIKARTEACRAIIYYVARSMDIARHHKNAATRQTQQDIVDLLTPVAKAYSTDYGFSNASLAMQVFGGIGYIEETGIAQNLRDARIAMIYEGTNGIQAMDLVFRKLTLHDGRLFESFVSSLKLGENHHPTPLPDVESTIANYLATLKTATTKMQALVKENPEQAGMLATTYLQLFGTAIGGIFLNNSKDLANGSGTLSKEFVEEKSKTVDFFNKFILPEINYLADIII